MFDIWTFFQIVPVLVLLYFYINQKYSYWSSRGVKGPRPIFPFGYTLAKALYRPDELEKRYSAQYGKVYGVYTGLLPTLTITDAELIKQVLVKDFHHFVNRRKLNSFDEIWNHNLFASESESWKRIRRITSPAFTSGKLRGMYPLMNKCIEKLTMYLDRSCGQQAINTKEVIAGFTIDVIASTSFATETNANDDRSKKNPFVHHGLNIFNFNPLKVASILILPRRMLDLLGLKHFFRQDSFEFFVSLTRNVIEQRKNAKVKPNDLVQLMIDSFAYEDDLKEVSYDKLTASIENDDSNEYHETTSSPANSAKKMLGENEIIAQCLLFFFAGFETTAATLTYTIFEMAHNPAIQDRLLEEVNQAVEGVDEQNLDKYFDKLLNHVPYLDAVVKETLRKYPPVVRLERRVGADGVKLAGIPLDKDVLIEIPTVSVHRNPEYYPEPELYNPDRFMPENKHLLVPYTYIPFGQGPRNCIGMRFAYQEAKLCLAKVVQQFRFQLTSDTPKELDFAKGSPMLNAIPFPIKVSRR